MDEFGDGDVEFGEGNADVTADEGSTDIPDTIPEDSDVDTAPGPDDGYDVEPESFQEDVEGGEVADSGEDIADDPMAGEPDDLPEDVAADDPPDGFDASSDAVPSTVDIDSSADQGAGISLDIDHSGSGDQAQVSGISLDIDHGGTDDQPGVSGLAIDIDHGEAADAIEDEPGDVPSIDDLVGLEGESSADGDLVEDSAAGDLPDTATRTDRTCDLSENTVADGSVDEISMTPGLEGSSDSEGEFETSVDGSESGVTSDSKLGEVPFADELTNEVDAMSDAKTSTLDIKTEDSSNQEAMLELTSEHENPMHSINNNGNESKDISLADRSLNRGVLPMHGETGGDVASSASAVADNMPDTGATDSLDQDTVAEPDINYVGSLDAFNQGDLTGTSLTKDLNPEEELSMDKDFSGDAVCGPDMPVESKDSNEQPKDVSSDGLLGASDHARDAEGPSLSQYQEAHKFQDALYEQYKSKLIARELEREDVSAAAPLKWIQASEICGVMGDDGVDNKEFWSQHGASRDDYGVLATAIGEIKSRLDNKEDLGQILQDKRLKNYWSIMESEPIRVAEYNGSYFLDGNGRHRARIAEELGLPVPVRVTSRFREKSN